MHCRPAFFTGFGVLCGLVGLLTGTLANTNIAFRLSAKNLPAYDPLGGYPDPYVVITYENPPNTPIKLGQTSIIDDTTEPSWPDLFNIVHINGSNSQILTLDLYDEDFDTDDYMGSLNVSLSEITTSFGATLERDIIRDNSTVMGQMRITANLTSTGLQ